MAAIPIKHPDQLRRLKNGARVVLVNGGRVERGTLLKRPLRCDLIMSPRDSTFITEWEIANGRVFAHGPGPCPHCREGAGLVRDSKGEWRQCKQCFSGWL